MISSDQLYRTPVWFSGKGPENDVIISTRIRLARNLAGHTFPNRASLQERKSVFEDVAQACAGIPQCKGFTVANFVGLKSLNQQYLVEDRAASPDMLRLEGDRGVVGDTDREVSIMINEEDHIRLQAMGSGACAEELWSRIDTIDTAVGKKLNLAFDRRRGFLTCCPTNSGTGLRVSFLMHLFGLTLTKAIDQVLQGASQMGISTRGFFGENSEIVGNVFQLSNQATMGSHESEFLESTEGLIREIISLERQARERILAEAGNELEDKVYRAYGILRHARTLEIDEFLNLSSALRAGIDCGLFEGVSLPELNRLTLLIMPAHIQILYDREMDERELRSMRAEIVRNFFDQKVDGTAS